METSVLSPAQLKKSSAIVAAARLHFATHGFEATKLSEVAKDAGVAVGTIYLRYKSKAELLGGVLAEVDETIARAVDTPAIWATPFPERFGLVVLAVLETAGSQEDLPTLMALSSFASSPNAPPKKPMIDKICEHVRAGINDGVLRSDVDVNLVAHMAHGMVDGAMRDLLTNPARKPEDVVRHIADAYEKWLMPR